MNRLLYFCFVLFLFSCSNDKPVLSETYEFDDNLWSKDKQIEFAGQFMDSDCDYKIKISITYTTEYPYSNLIFSLKMMTPEGTERNIDFEIFLKDENRNQTGTVSGDNYVFEFDAIKRTSFKDQGMYTFILFHHMPLSGVMGIKSLTMEIYKLHD